MKTVLFAKKPIPDPELIALKAELEAAREDLALAYRQFDQALDPELVESCVYQISAVKARCNYLIRSIKERSPEAVPALSRLPAANRRGAGGEKKEGGEGPSGDGQCGADNEGDTAWT